MTCETLISILITSHDTIIIYQAKTCNKVSLFVTTFYRKIVLETPTITKHFVIPICILTFVVNRTQQVLIDISKIALIINIVFCIKQFSFLTK